MMSKMGVDVNEILKSLVTVINGDTKDKDGVIISDLKLITSCTDQMIHNDYLHLFIELLNPEGRPSIQIAVTEALAELSKQKDNRELFTEKDIIKRLIEHLNSDSPELVFASIRALGNICYENEDGTKLVDEIGIDPILNILKICSQADANDLLTQKVCGLILNLLSTFDEISNTFLKKEILKSIENLLEKIKKPTLKENEEIITLILNILNILTDYLEECNYEFSENLINLIMRIFKVSQVQGISMLCLQIFYSLVENNMESNNVKCQLDIQELCEILHGLVEKHRDKEHDDSRTIKKMACDLIVLVLSGDIPLQYLYANGTGPTFLNMLTWLQASDKELLCTGVLAVGNFARNDIHCIHMVQNGMLQILIYLLKQCRDSNDKNDINLQYAILSTLRNLVIPTENKAKAADAEIIDVLYPMLQQECFKVLFKLLGIYRMMIDGQPAVASDLLSRRDFIERLAYWRYNCEEISVISEIPRIFCWLIKNVKSSDLFPSFVSMPNAVRCIADLMLSNYALMQNEALVSLTLLAVALEKHPEDEYDEFLSKLCEADIGKHLYVTIKKYSEKWDFPSMLNCTALLEQLVRSDAVVNNLKKNHVDESIRKIMINKNVGTNLQRLEQVLNVLDKSGNQMDADE